MTRWDSSFISQCGQHYRASASEHVNSYFANVVKILAGTVCKLSSASRESELVLLKLYPVLPTFVCNQLLVRNIVVPYLHLQSNKAPYRKFAAWRISRWLQKHQELSITEDVKSSIEINLITALGPSDWKFVANWCWYQATHAFFECRAVAFPPFPFTARLQPFNSSNVVNTRNMLFQSRGTSFEFVFFHLTRTPGCGNSRNIRNKFFFLNWDHSINIRNTKPYETSA